MLLTIQEFLKRRPDMEVHMESAIQSAINSSFILLDGECAGLISQVQAYRESGENDINNEYYRSDFEISQLIEALTSQTQYSLNLGNDYSIGGGSYSIGNVNSSYNRPEGRDIVAPGVYKLLSNARVYNLNVGIGVSQKQDHYLAGIDPADKHISISKAQSDFVAKYQPNANVGNVAYVNQSNMVDFARPQDLQIGTYNTNRVAGGEGHRNNYYEIDNVPNIAFFGPNDNGTYSAIHRGEVKEILNNNYLTKEQVFRVVYASGIVWNSRLNYERGWISQEVVNNVLCWYEALEDNTNKRPSQNPTIWKKLETQVIDINAIYQQIEPFIDQKITQEVAQQLMDTINNLPTLDYIEETKNQVLFFNSEQDFINFKNETGTTDRDFENVPFNTTPNNVATTDTTQTITGAKTFTNNVVISKNPTPLILKANTNDKTYMLIKSSDDTTNFSLGANSTNTSLEVNRGDLTIKTLQANKNVNFENVARVKLYRSVLETGTEINAGYGGLNVKFIPEDSSTKTLQFYNGSPTDARRFNLLVPNPTEAQNPATKQYVDNAIANNSGGSVDTSNLTTLNTNQTITGWKTFTDAITITKRDGALQFKPGTNAPAYFEFYNGNTRVGYIGKSSSTNNDLEISSTAKIKLGATSGIEIPQPTNNNNPTTKQYVDQQITNVESNINNEMLNYVSLGSEQTITGQKTFTKNLYLQKDNPVLYIKATNNSNAELSFLNLQNSGTFNIQSNNTKTSLNSLGGRNLELVAAANSAIIEFKTNRVKLGSSILETGTEINAGYGGTSVKFIPEANSTKTLQFYESSNTSTRRFNLLVPEPTTNNNPATKNYVDNFIQKRDYTFNVNSTPTLYGEQYLYQVSVSDLQETTIVGVNVSFKDNANVEAKSIRWNVSWNTTWGPKLYIKLFIDKFAYNAFSNKNDINLDWTKIMIRVFYIPKYNSRESEKVYEGEVVNLNEVLGGK